MTRDEIYNHLAQVYLGKRNRSEEQQQDKFNAAWLLINIGITAIIFASAVYGLTAFLAHRADSLQSNVIYALNNGPIRIPYNVNSPYPSVKTFSLSIPKVDLSKYSTLNLNIRGFEEGVPGIVKIVITNERNETSFYFINNIGLKWQEFNIPIKEFGEVTDWTNLVDISFVFEAWNVEDKKGIVLIDDVSFSS